ncbi:MAG: IS30 family transposase [Gammaproteobacteria bacterium]|nr:IS30 family transposase [Gammaproteobacteria bacterium]
MGKNIKKYGLSLLERERIATYRVMGKSCRQIGDLLGRHHTTISRELKRNNKPHPMMTGYISYLAHQQAKARKRNAGARKRLKSSFIRTFVQNKLLLEWTPELIAGRLSIEYPGYKISHEAIYQYIYSDFREGIKYLARKRPKRYSRHYSRKRRVSSIPARTSITDRPAVINARKTIGHWESDSIESRQSKDILNVKLERKSRFVLVDKVSSKCSDDTHQVIIRRLKRLPDKFRKSITYDNGSENYSHNKTN